MNSFEWTNARTVDEAIAQLGGSAGGTVVVKAGGVDLLDRLKEGLEAPQRLVNIRNIAGLDSIRDDAKDGLRIGPLVTLARLSSDPIVRRGYGALAESAGHAATPQIRNMATVGGNLLQRPRCWYFRSEQFHCLKKGGSRCFAIEGENQYHAIFDNKLCAIVHPSGVATALVALGAKLELTGAKGKREVALEQFFIKPEQDVRRENSLGASELVTEIRVPAPTANMRSAYIKQREKESFDWPIAEVAVALQCAGNRCSQASIVLGAAAPVPWRARDAEVALADKEINPETARAAARAATNGATPLSQNGYKVPIFEAVIRRAILAAAMNGGV
jgi:xanthine dehydrogenase YagS FAD-binding subunit